MATCLVTGVAGFISSHLAERLLAEGHEVIGVDCFTDHYPRSVKEANLCALREAPGFRFLPLDLRTAELAPLLEGVTCVFHQAAQAGVRASWGAEFELYVEHNVLATQRLLEAVKDAGPGVRRFVFASSSSVYGNVQDLPVREDSLPRPYSPYGVTKLAAEHLCGLYHHNFGLPTVSLRYFTVYGPRQRPDMAFHRFIKRMLSRKAEIVHRPAQHGDVRDTWADTSRARAELGFRPQVSLEEGLFVITAFWTRRTRHFDRRERIWPLPK